MMASRLGRLLRVSSPTARLSFPSVASSRARFMSGSLNSGDEGEDDVNSKGADPSFADLLRVRPESQLQGVDPRKGWAFRGVHKAIICGKVGQNPTQKILRSGRTITIFTVGTGGLYDQRVVWTTDLPKPAQWHRIVVHSETLGRFAVQQLVKSSSVYVEGDMETRVYNDINGEIRTVPEICVHRDGKIRLMKSAETVNDSIFDDLRDGLFE